MFPRKTTNSTLEYSSSKLDNDDLSSRDDEPNNNIHLIIHDSLENVFLIIDLSGVEHVEDLEHDENIEDISQMSAWAISRIFVFIKRWLIPIESSTRVNIGVNSSSFESPFWIGFRVEMFSSEHNSIDTGNLEEWDTKNDLNHLSGNDVFISLVRWSLKQFFFRCFCSQGKRS